MIQANELRIGNWVTWNEDDTFMRVGATSFLLPDARFDPIPLTPEILEKAGFVLNMNGLYVVNGFWVSFKHGAFTPVYCDGSSFARFIGVHIDHLHQLQNLYFALTGEELNVKL